MYMYIIHKYELGISSLRIKAVSISKVILSKYASTIGWQLSFNLQERVGEGAEVVWNGLH